jgi:hypothetical protein
MPLAVRLTPVQRRALELLAAAPEGCNEPLLRIDHGIDTPVTISLVEEGLLSARRVRVRMRAGTRSIVIVKVQITDAGREALGRQ